MGKAHNLQDYFLNHVRRDNTEVTIFLMSGYQIKGLVKGFDPFTVVIDDGVKQQLIYKHAISTIIPKKEVNLIKN
ncbi:RNA chaperone Hfq [Proteinivorax hydrogeniformans]|uniref:RNA-binding protein Hfq n=1 Tax=Proteinivorax hydrogeniformans TaxID=1826727 RepID=A0AAU8HX29_9FIRM